MGPPSPAAVHWSRADGWSPRPLSSGSRLSSHPCPSPLLPPAPCQAVEAAGDSVPFSAPSPSHFPQAARLQHHLHPPLLSLHPTPAILVPGLAQEEERSWPSLQVGLAVWGRGTGEGLQVP